MKLFALVCLVALVSSCDASYTVRVDMPYCPTSDSAKARADSIPVLCKLPDSLRTQ